MIRHTTPQSRRLRAAVIGAGLAAVAATGLGVGAANAATGFDTPPAMSSYSTHQFGDATHHYRPMSDHSWITTQWNQNRDRGQFGYAGYREGHQQDSYASEHHDRGAEHHRDCHHREPAGDRDMPGHPDRFEPGEVNDAF
ncbi:MAG: hypothetical protein SW127_15365 [Actinomycetota bacterium]|nr:hypothetical protein [Actinomycetota bacterium]